MSTVPLFPSLDLNIFQTPRVPGVWQQENGEDFLDDLGKAIVVEGIPDDAAKEVSIPDVWAPIRLFELALLNDKHVLHDRVVEEWRGLLALLALKGARNLDVAVAKIKVPPKPHLSEGISRYQSKASFAGSSSAAFNRRFDDSVAKLRPSDDTALFHRQTWDELGKITYCQRHVAFVVPSVLVAPIRGYEAALDQRLDWAGDGNRLQDPSKVRQIQGQDLAIISKFLEDLSKALKKNQINARDLYQLNTILRLLDGFHAALLRREGASLPQASFVFRSAGYSLPDAPYNDALDCQYILKTGPRYATKLRVRTEFADLLAGALLVDPAMTQALRQTPDQLPLWGADTFQSLLRDPDKLATIRQEAAEEGFLTLSVADLFTEDLCLTVGEADLLTHNPSCRKFVLPLQPVVMLFMSPEGINAAIQIREKNTEYTVQLYLTVYDEKDNPRQCIVEKTYARIAPLKAPRNLSTWPDFVAPDWSAYFLYYLSNPKEELCPRAALSIKPMQEALEAPQPRLRVERAANFLKTVIDTTPVKMILDLPTVSCSLLSIDEYPEAIVCECAFSGEDDRNPADIRTVGLILCEPRPNRPAQSADEMRVGIDFGSTNTSVYFAIGSGKLEQLNFVSRSVTPFSVRRKDGEESHALEFLPLQEITIPFLTILEERRNNGSTEPKPLWSDRIHYVPDAAHMADRLLKGDKTLMFNLKWGTTERERRKVQLFLGQVALQALAEAAARGIPAERVRWSFSYPQEAFTRAQEEDYEGLCPTAISLALDRNGSRPPAPPPAVNCLAESLCNARYFAAREKAYFEDTVLTVDVGGGTTDMMLAQGQRALWRSSLRYAGRDVLINYLIENPELLERLSTKNTRIRQVVDHLKEMDAIQDRERQTHAVEILVNSAWYQEQASLQFPVLKGDHTSGLPGLVRIAEFSLAGILFYVAEAISFLSQPREDEEEPQFRHGAARALHICLGGKGSLAFRSLVGKDATDKILKMFQREASLLRAPQDIAYSDHPKHEVAYGLLAEGAGARVKISLEGVMSEAVLGEKLIVDGIPLDPRLPPPHSILRSDARWSVRGLPRIQRFVEAYQKACGRRVSFTPDIEDRLCSTITEELEQMRERMLDSHPHRQPQGERPWLQMEPLYGVALRCLTRELIRQKNAIT